MPVLVCFSDASEFSPADLRLINQSDFDKALKKMQESKHFSVQNMSSVELD